jgi:hypothetical protein
MRPPVAAVPHVCHPPGQPRTRRGRLLERALAPFGLIFALLGALVAMLASRTQMAGPGVTVETFPTPGPSDNSVAPGATLFLAGLCDRGTATGTITVRSYPDFLARCGAYASYGNLHDQVKLYFQLGGTRAIIARVVGGSATKGTLTLADRDGTPDPTLRVDALDAGAWSATLEVQVANGDLANTYTISIWLGGELKETFANLATPAAGVAALAASAYVRGTDLASGTTAPSNNPVVLARTVLSTGSDDRASVNAAALVTALGRFTDELGDGIVAIPGYDSSTVGAGLLAHAHAFNRLAVLATTRTAAVAAAKTAAAALNNTTGNEAALLAYPWVKVDDGAGGIRSISPEGYVAGVRARAHVQEGPWRAAAGKIATATQILGVETELTETEGADLNDNRVSAIRKVGGQWKLYGYRSLSLDEVHYRFPTTRDVLDYVAHQGRAALQDMVFGTIDSKGHFQAQCETAIINILEPMLNAGGLYELRDPNTGEIVDTAYDVDAGPGVNLAEDLAAGQFTVVAYLRVSPTAEKIRLRITAVALEETLA